MSYGSSPYGFAYADGYSAPAPVVAVWPTPSQVLAGVTYGPTGSDYTGTATGGPGPSAADIAAAVWGTAPSNLGSTPESIASAIWRYKR